MLRKRNVKFAWVQFRIKISLFSELNFTYATIFCILFQMLHFFVLETKFNFHAVALYISVLLSNGLSIFITFESFLVFG